MVAQVIVDVRDADLEGDPAPQLLQIAGRVRANTVQREWAKRRLVVQANVRGRDVGGFVRAAQAAIDAKVRLPEGAYVRFGGQFEHLAAVQRRLLVVVPIAQLLIFALLYATHGRVLDAARVFLGVPFATVVIGGVVTSTMLTLFVLPALYLVVRRDVT